MRRLLFLSLMLVAACGGYTQVQQSSFVPVPQMPPPPSLRGRSDIYFGDSLVTVLGSRELRTNENAGLWLARHQLDGSITLRLSRFFSLRGMGGAALPFDANVASPTTLPNPGRVAPWGGMGVIFNYLDAGGWGIDGEFDTSLVLSPSLMRTRQCNQDSVCGEWSDLYSNQDLVPMVAATVRTRYAPNDWITVWTGFTVRNHPSNLADFRDAPGYAHSSMGFGDPTLVIGAGAEFIVEDVFSIIPHMSWPIAGGPVSYGPNFGVALRVHFGEGPGDRLPPWTTPPEPDPATRPWFVVPKPPLQLSRPAAHAGRRRVAELMASGTPLPMR